MSSTIHPTRRADYGIDDRDTLRKLIYLGIATIMLGGLVDLFLWPANATLAAGLLYASILVSIGCVITAAGMFWNSKMGKYHARNWIMRSIPWHGNEDVLDVGYGRGLVLIAAAKHLIRGKAVGVDIGSGTEQPGVRREAAWANASAENVTERIELKDGDAQRLPFPNQAFDVVLSSLAIHHLPDAGDRSQAIQEIARVLKRGGRIALFDTKFTDEYAQTLSECGLIHVKRSAPRFFFFALTPRLVTGQKP